MVFGGVGRGDRVLSARVALKHCGRPLSPANLVMPVLRAGEVHMRQRAMVVPILEQPPNKASEHQPAALLDHIISAGRSPIFLRPFHHVLETRLLEEYVLSGPCAFAAQPLQNPKTRERTVSRAPSLQFPLAHPLPKPPMAAIKCPQECLPFAYSQVSFS